MITKKGDFKLNESLKSYNNSFLKNTPRLISTNSINHFRKGFTNNGGQTEKSKSGWDARQHTSGKGKRNVLVKTGALLRSISNKLLSSTKIIIGITGITNVYGEAHNDGAKIRITEKMRKYFWAQYYDTKNDYWKNLALTKNKHINIPQREFIGDSKQLELSNEKIIFEQLNKIWKR